jgi:carbonic anhydrase
LYKGVEFHFHSPSEHLFHGDICHDLELHIVHDLLEGPSQYKYSKAVVGVLFNKMTNRDNEFIESLNIESLQPCPRIDLKNFANSLNKRVYYYDGSLTTPPCSEIVHW